MEEGNKQQQKKEEIENIISLSNKFVPEDELNKRRVVSFSNVAGIIKELQGNKFISEDEEERETGQDEDDPPFVANPEKEEEIEPYGSISSSSSSNSGNTSRITFIPENYSIKDRLRNAKEAREKALQNARGKSKKPCPCDYLKYGLILAAAIGVGYFVYSWKSSTKVEPTSESLALE